MEQVFVLLVVFQAKHFIADFPLQGKYMLGKMQLHNWILPLAAHASVHALLTFAIVFTVNPELWWIAIIDFVMHFSIDRIKASPNILNRWSPTEPYFWWALGADQMMHHLTHYYFIYLLIS